MFTVIDIKFTNDYIFDFEVCHGKITIRKHAFIYKKKKDPS